MSASSPRLPARALFIVGNEACERFGYYGVSAILTLYMVKQLGKTGDEATMINHLFKSACYLTPLLGAYLADRWLGRYKTILILSLFYCVGNAALALGEGTIGGLYLGLGLIALGSGGIKPCISAFIGDQFDESNKALISRAYSLFYWAINFGSFFSFIVIPFAREKWGYAWAFGIPGIFMGIALIIFLIGTRTYTRIPPEGNRPGFMSVFNSCIKAADIGLPLRLSAVATLLLILSALFGGETVPVPVLRTLQAVSIIGALISLRRLLPLLASTEFWQRACGKFDDELIGNCHRVAGILGLFALIPVFWALFDQTGSTWLLQGVQMTPISFDLPFSDTPFKLDAETIQSANSLFVMLLIPFCAFVLYPVCTRLGYLPTPLRRMVAGMALAALAYVSSAWIQYRIDGGETLSVLWQTLPYLLITLGEVLFSTTGLEFAFTQAPKSMKSTIMSFWSLTVTFGNFLVAGIAHMGSSLFGPAKAGEHAPFIGGGAMAQFLFYAVLMTVVTVVFAKVCRRYLLTHGMHA